MSPPFQPALCARAPFLNALLSYANGDGWDAIVYPGDHVGVYRRGWDRVRVVDVVDGSLVVAVPGDDGETHVTLGDDDYHTIVASPVADAVWEDHQKSTTPDGVASADGLVSAGLTQRLTTLFDRLCDAPVDYHPGSGTAVRDLVHPSLYSYVHEVSPLGPGVVPPALDGHPSVDRWGRPFEGSRFAWLPTEVDVDAHGGVRFASYLNNLDTSVDPAPLAELLQVALPLLESVYGYAQAFDAWDHREDDCEADLPEPDALSDPPVPVAPVSLRGRRLQVVPKLVQYELDGETSFDGVWHVEGMSHEHIVATALFILDRDPDVDGGTIRFKRGYTREEAGQVFWNIAQCRPEPVDEMVDRGMIPLGSVDTPAGRLVVFPNSHVHKLTPMTSRSGSLARRRIVVFWLVDPDHRILSTADVPPQQGVVPRADALANRLALMEERKRHKQSHNLREISLCEH